MEIKWIIISFFVICMIITLSLLFVYKPWNKNKDNKNNNNNLLVFYTGQNYTGTEHVMKEIVMPDVGNGFSIGSVKLPENTILFLFTQPKFGGKYRITTKQNSSIIDTDLVWGSFVLHTLDDIKVILYTEPSYKGNSYEFTNSKSVIDPPIEVASLKMSSFVILFEEKDFGGKVLAIRPEINNSLNPATINPVFTTRSIIIFYPDVREPALTDEGNMPVLQMYGVNIYSGTNFTETRAMIIQNGVYQINYWGDKKVKSIKPAVDSLISFMDDKGIVVSSTRGDITDIDLIIGRSQLPGTSFITQFKVSDLKEELVRNSNQIS